MDHSKLLLFMALVAMCASLTLANGPRVSKLSELDAYRPERCGFSRNSRKSLKKIDRLSTGYEAKPAEFPWFVQLRDGHNSNKLYCGGALIHKDLVLTAAHCTRKDQSFDYALVGVNNETDASRGQKIEIDPSVQCNEPARPGVDLALIRLKRPVKYDKYVQPICLNNIHDRKWFPNTCTFAGMGMTRLNQPSTKLLAIPMRPCGASEVGILQLSPNIESCYRTADDLNYNSEPCPGDSGSPMVCKDPNTGASFALGVASRGRATCFRQSPFAFVDLIKTREDLKKLISSCLKAKDDLNRRKNSDPICDSRREDDDDDGKEEDDVE